MRSLALAPFGIGAVLCASVSCGSDGSGGAAGATGVDPAAVQQFIAAYCSLLLPCCADEGIPGIGQCQTLYESFAESLVFDPILAASCLQKVRTEATEPTFCISPRECLEAFVMPGGTLPLGQPCTGNDQCANAPGAPAACSAATVITADGGCTLTDICTQMTYGQLGQEPCEDTVTDIGPSFTGPEGCPSPAKAFLCDVSDDLYCASNTGQCTTLATTGQLCSDDMPCAVSDFCSPPLDSLTLGSCAPFKADGASCDGVMDVSCGPLSYCDPTALTCRPRLAHAAPCTLDPQCLSGRCTNGVCEPYGWVSLYCGP
jgi:hypothetical protein